jgi:hypothetical protein
MQELISGFEARGVKIVANHPRCSEPSLEGLYVRGTREVIVCEKGDQSSTLRHEGWHLVQSRCLAGHPWLSNEQVEARLSRQDRKELLIFVERQNWPREGEARVMAQLPPKAYFEAIDRACSLTPEDNSM